MFWIHSADDILVPCPTSENRKNFKVQECSLFWSRVSPGFRNHRSAPHRAENVAIETFTLPPIYIWSLRVSCLEAETAVTVHCGIGDGYLYPHINYLPSSFMDGRICSENKNNKISSLYFFKNSARIIWDGLTRKLSHRAVLAAQCLVSQLRWGI